MNNMIYRAVIEGINDPLKLGRVQVRVLGLHTSSKEELPSTSLPWADVLMPIGAGIYGEKPVPVLGGWCYVMPKSSENIEFIVLGMLQSNYQELPDFSIGYSDPSQEFPIEEDLNQGRNPLDNKQQPHNTTNLNFPLTDIVPEQCTNLSESEYPFDRIYLDKAGNLIEVDSTDIAPRIRIQHSSGTKIEIDKLGNMVVTSNGNASIWHKGLYTINADGHLLFEGDLKIMGNLEVTGQITSTGNITSRADVLSNTVSLTNHIHSQGSDSGGDSQVDTNAPNTTTPSHFTWTGIPTEYVDCL